MLSKINSLIDNNLLLNKEIREANGKINALRDHIRDLQIENERFRRLSSTSLGSEIQKSPETSKNIPTSGVMFNEASKTFNDS